MNGSLVLVAMITVALSQMSLAENAPATQPSASASGANEAPAGSFQFQSLQAVLDAQERRQDWHTAAQRSADRIQDPNLRAQFNRRIAGLVPSVAKSLVGHGQEDALVSVAVFRDLADAKHQVMIAVTFDGLGGEIGESFFANVMAGTSKPPEADGIPRNLVLDTKDSGFLVFFLGKNELLAGDIPQASMSQSVMAMVKQQRQFDLNATGAVAAAPKDNAAQSPPRDVVNADASSVAQYGNYINTSAYQPVNDGYSYPTTTGVPMVILPGDSTSTDASLSQRQMALQQRYQNNPYGITAQNGNFITPQSGNSIKPQPANVITPQSANYVTPQSRSNNTPQSGSYVKPGSGNYNKSTAGNSNSGGSGNSNSGGAGNSVKSTAGNSNSGGSGNSNSSGSGNSVKPSAGNNNGGGSGNSNSGSGNHVNPPPANRPSAPTHVAKPGEPGGPPK